MTHFKSFKHPGAARWKRHNSTKKLPAREGPGRFFLLRSADVSALGCIIFGHRLRPPC